MNARGVSGPLDYNVDFTHFQTDGYRDHSAAQRESGNGKLNIRLSDTAKLTLLFNTVNIPGAQDPLGLTRAQFEADPRSVTPVAEQFDTRKTVQQSQGGAIFEQQFGGGNTLRVMGYYGQRDVTQFLAIPVMTQGNPLHSGGVVDLSGEYAGTDVRWTWKGDLAGRPFEIAAGLNYDKQDQGRQGHENFVGDVLGVRGALRRNEDDTVFDFDQYAQATWAFAEAWSLTAGVRHSEVQIRFRRSLRHRDESGRQRTRRLQRDDAGRGTDVGARRTRRMSTPRSAKVSKRRHSTSLRIAPTAARALRSISCRRRARTASSA